MFSNVLHKNSQYDAEDLKHQIMAICYELAHAYNSDLSSKDDLFSNLETLLYAQDEAFIKHLLLDEQFRDLHGDLIRVRSKYETEKEVWLAKKIIALKQSVYQYGLGCHAWYEELHKFEISVLKKYQPKSLLLAGVGPLPTSAIAFAMAFPAAEIIGLDHSAQACELAQQVTAALGISNLSIVYGDLMDVDDFSPFDCVVNSVLIGLTADEKKAVCSHLKLYSPKDTLLAIRTAVGYGQVFYPSSRLEDLSKLKFQCSIFPPSLLWTLALSQ